MKLSHGGPFLGRDDVRSWARELRVRYGDDPLRVCSRLGISVITIEDGREDWDARLLYRDMVWLIVVNRLKPAVRRQFAVAHELIHWAIIRNTLIDPPAGAALEELCDFGAHELLFS